MAYRNYLRYAEVHFPPGEGTSGFLDMLKDSIDVMDMFPDELSNSKVCRYNLVV